MTDVELLEASADFVKRVEAGDDVDDVLDDVLEAYDLRGAELVRIEDLAAHLETGEDRLGPLAVAYVGAHYASGIQSHVPRTVLEELDVDEGDYLVYRLDEPGRVVLERRRSP